MSISWFPVWEHYDDLASLGIMGTLSRAPWNLMLRIMFKWVVFHLRICRPPPLSLRSGHLDIKDEQCSENKDGRKISHHIISRLYSEWRYYSFGSSTRTRCEVFQSRLILKISVTLHAWFAVFLIASHGRYKNLLRFVKLKNYLYFLRCR